MPTDSDTSPRLGLPLLVSGQAQKEVTHNEALLLIDMLISPLVESVGANQPPANPAIGRCWIVGNAPTGAWIGAANRLIIWTIGGWRSLLLPDLAEVRERTSGKCWILSAQGWTAAPGWTAPNGGTTVDTVARSALNSLAQIMAARGLLSAT